MDIKITDTEARMLLAWINHSIVPHNNDIPEEHRDALYKECLPAMDTLFEKIGVDPTVEEINPISLKAQRVD